MLNELLEKSSLNVPTSHLWGTFGLYTSEHILTNFEGKFYFQIDTRRSKGNFKYQLESFNEQIASLCSNMFLKCMRRR